MVKLKEFLLLNSDRLFIWYYFKVLWWLVCVGGEYLEESLFSLGFCMICNFVY